MAHSIPQATRMAMAERYVEMLDVYERNAKSTLGVTNLTIVEQMAASQDADDAVQAEFGHSMRDLFVK